MNNKENFKEKFLELMSQSAENASAKPAEQETEVEAVGSAATEQEASVSEEASAAKPAGDGKMSDTDIQELLKERLKERLAERNTAAEEAASEEPEAMGEEPDSEGPEAEMAEAEQTEEQEPVLNAGYSVFDERSVSEGIDAEAAEPGGLQEQDKPSEDQDFQEMPLQAAVSTFELPAFREVSGDEPAETNDGETFEAVQTEETWSEIQDSEEATPYKAMETLFQEAVEEVKNGVDPSDLSLPIKENQPLSEVSIITTETFISGMVTTKGHVRMEGALDGNLRAVGDVKLSGKISGDVEGDNLELLGCEMSGNLSAAGSAEIAKDVILRGDVAAQNLVIDGSIKGNVLAVINARMSENAFIEGSLTTDELAMSPGAKLSGMVKVGQK